MDASLLTYWPIFTFVFAIVVAMVIAMIRLVWMMAKLRLEIQLTLTVHTGHIEILQRQASELFVFHNERMRKE